MDCRIKPGNDETGLRESYTEKLVPQPQDAVTLGLLSLNWAPIKSSTKSSSAPCTKPSEMGSTTTRAPSRSTRKSSGAVSVTRSKRYWKPEQPPPSTLTRNSAGAASLRRSSAMRRTARGLMVMDGSLILGVANLCLKHRMAQALVNRPETQERSDFSRKTGD